MATSHDEIVLARMLVSKIDAVTKALDELSLAAYDPATKTYTNEDLSDYVDNIRSLMSFSMGLVQHAREVRVEQGGEY